MTINVKIENNPNSRVPALLERTYQPLYATQTVGPGIQNIRFLSPKEDKDAYYERMYSNIPLGNMLPYPYHFQLTGISIIPSYNAKPHHVKSLIDKGHFSFTIGPKEYLSLPLDAVTYYSHLQGHPQSDGEPLATSKLKISEPVFELPKISWMDIPPLKTLGATIQIKESLKIKPFALHLYLFGYHLRPVH